MRVNFGVLLSVSFAVAILFLAGAAVAADPPEMKSIRDSYLSASQGIANEEQRQALIDDYIQQLTSLEFYLRSNMRSREDVNAVRHEIRKIKETRYEAPKVKADFSSTPIAKPAPKAVAATLAPQAAKKPSPAPVAVPKITPVTATPAPVPVASTPVVVPAVVAAPKPPAENHIPQLYSSGVQGIAGADDFSKNNIYSFNIKDIGQVSTLSYWAAGRSSTDSYGKVWVVSPDGRRHEAGTWKEKYFEISAKEVDTYKKLKPITTDISDIVTSPGTYKVEFDWTGGIEPLIIYRVEITS